jgi:hypothetical protein
MKLLLMQFSPVSRSFLRLTQKIIVSCMYIAKVVVKCLSNWKTLQKRSHTVQQGLYLYYVPADIRLWTVNYVLIQRSKRIFVLNWWFSVVPIPVIRGRLTRRYSTCCGRKLVPRKLWRRLKYHVWRSGSSHEVADTVLWLGGWPRTSCYPSYFITIFIFTYSIYIWSLLSLSLCNSFLP